MGKLKTRARVNMGDESVVQLPTGRLEDQISRSDLEANPEKHIHQYPHLYENAGELRHEAGTRSQIKRVSGSKVKIMRRVANNGVSYNVFMGKRGKVTPTKRSAKIVSTPSNDSALLAAQQKQIEKLRKELEAAQAAKEAETTKKTSSRKRSTKKDEDK